MSWLRTAFQDKKPITEDHPHGAVEAVTFEAGAKPGWASPTGMWEAVGHKALGSEPWTATRVVADTPPMPTRTPS